MIPLFHPDYRTPDYAAQLRDLPHDIAGLSAQNAKPIGDPALFDKSIEVVHELIQTLCRLMGANLEQAAGYRFGAVGHHLPQDKSAHYKGPEASNDSGPKAVHICE